MVSFIRFSPLSDSHSDKPVCSLLEIENTKILLDCGWEPPFDTEDLKYLKKYAKEVDCVLLTHASLRHCGGLVYACTTLGLSCPIYATFPVQTMGKFTLLEALHNLCKESSFSLFQCADVNHIFGKISLLKFSQPQTLSGKSQDIVITAYMAGHTVGGTFWKIKRNTEEFLYVMDIHHRKERHLAPSYLFATGSVAPITRPSALILGCKLSKELPAKTRDSQFLDPILQTLHQGGDVLLPVDAACRVLELIYVIDTFWAQHRLPFPIFFVSKMGKNVLRAAAGMLEWFSENLTQAFSMTRESPFDLKSLTFADRIDSVLQHRGPKLILATDASMDMGPSRELFFQMHSNPKNLIVLPLSVPSNSLAYKLGTFSQTPRPMELEWTYSVRVPMIGEKLSQYLHAREMQSQTAKQVSMLMQQNRSILEAELTDEEELGENFTTNASGLFQGHDAFVYNLPNATFPYIEHRRRFDDYGETIVHEEYVTEADRLEMQAAQKHNDTTTQSMVLPEWDMELEDDATEPFEYQSTKSVFHVHSSVLVADMNGLIDERSLLAMTSLIQAKKVILLGSSSCGIFLDRFQTNHQTLETFAPSNGESLNLSSSKDVQQVKLTDALSTAMEMQKYGTYDLGLVHAIVRSSAASVPILDLAVTNMDPTPSFVIGQLKLSEFKVILDQEGYDTKFINGVLIINDKLGIFKPRVGELKLEGQLCKEYFQVRALLYKQHVIF